jgi:hypothetical protein
VQSAAGDIVVANPSAAARGAAVHANVASAPDKQSISRTRMSRIVPTASRGEPHQLPLGSNDGELSRYRGLPGL